MNGVVIMYGGYVVLDGKDVTYLGKHIGTPQIGEEFDVVRIDDGEVIHCRIDGFQYLFSEQAYKLFVTIN